LEELIKNVNIDEGAPRALDVYSLLVQIVKLSYGKRKGDNFVQNDEEAQKFINSLAFDRFIKDLLIDDNCKIFVESLIN